MLGLPWVARRRVVSYHQVAFLDLFARGDVFSPFRVRIEEYGRLCGCKLFFAGDGCTGGLYGDAISHSDFQLNIKPPGFCLIVNLSYARIFPATGAEEQLEDVEASLDALLKVCPRRVPACDVV